MLFLTADVGALVACTGVRQAGEQPSLQGFGPGLALGVLSGAPDGCRRV